MTKTNKPYLPAIAIALSILFSVILVALDPSKPYPKHIFILTSILMFGVVLPLFTFLHYRATKHESHLSSTAAETNRRKRAFYAAVTPLIFIPAFAFPRFGIDITLFLACIFITSHQQLYEYCEALITKINSRHPDSQR
jgi:hypothetical protein